MKWLIVILKWYLNIGIPYSRDNNVNYSKFSVNIVFLRNKISSICSAATEMSPTLTEVIFHKLYISHSISCQTFSADSRKKKRGKNIAFCLMEKSWNLWRAGNKSQMRMEVVEKTLIYAPVDCHHTLLFGTK